MLLSIAEHASVLNPVSGAYIEAGQLFITGESSYATISKSDFGTFSNETTLGDNINDKTFLLKFTSGDSASLEYTGTFSFRVTRANGFSPQQIVSLLCHLYILNTRVWIEVLYRDGNIAIRNVGSSGLVSMHTTGVSPLADTDYCVVLSCVRDTSTCTSYVSANEATPVSEVATNNWDTFLTSAEILSFQLGYPMASYNGLAVYPQALSTDEDILEACLRPTSSPTSSPSESPTTSPTESPTSSPSTAPSKSPSTLAPSESPTVSPTSLPSMSPTTSPTEAPSTSPTVTPSTSPTMTPSVTPTVTPTIATDCDVSIVTQGGDGLSWDLTDDEGDEEIASGDLADSSASFTLGIGEDYLLFLSSSTLPSSATMNITVNGDSRVLELPAGTLLSTEIAGLTCEGLVDKISTIDSAYTLVVGLLSLGIALLLVA